MTNLGRIPNILEHIRRIQESNMSVAKYFRENSVPFTRIQYYRYCNTIKRSGIEGLKDKREYGNSKKFTERIKDYIIYVLQDNPYLSSSKLQSKIYSQFGVKISTSGINSFRASNSLTKLSPPKNKTREVQKASGGEIIANLAIFTGIIDVITQTISGRLDEIRESPIYKQNTKIEKDHPELRIKGKFTAEYNQLPSVRKNRFKSIDEKIPSKNFSAMRIFHMSEKTLFRYNMALLCLPLVTSNGRTSDVNGVNGNDLSFLCGCNYKDSSLNRYISELKHLQISDQLINVIGKFWIEFYRNFEQNPYCQPSEENDKSNYFSSNETFFACYYIDGNTKPLWSSSPCYKGKVTMLGRVMNCLENVFIHDSQGHPLYFQTFQGHADLGKNALNMLEKLKELTDDSSNQIHADRILVMDGGANGVKTLRAFSDSNEYYITILDDNQNNERKFKHIGEEKRYKYGKSVYTDDQIELIDSLDKSYIYECRAVRVKWDNGNQSVLVTNVPRDLLDADKLIKTYFDRWPKQEKKFRDAKNGVNIHRIVGYGKKLENYDKMTEKHQELSKSLSLLNNQLKEPLEEIRKYNDEIILLDSQVRIIREKSIITDGKRILSDKDSLDLKVKESDIKRIKLKIKKIKQEYKKEFKNLEKKTKEEARIRDKDKIYKIDTELDQIMTCFKLSFVNICTLFLSVCMNQQKFELKTLFKSIFSLTGKSYISEGEKTIDLDLNNKEPKKMEKLKNGLKILNDLVICDSDDNIVEFKVR